jgi:KaiC/GvpD/RAD55 family RecA-like ATPase
VNLDSDWFSKELLGDVSRSAKVDTVEEAIERAEAFMSEHVEETDTATTAPTRRSTGVERTGPVSTGSETLDKMLDGGLPPNRSVLLTGTPGTGKSTLAMQFLQAGLAEDERCLYISTEQTREEIRAAFADFAFDLSDENLGLSTIHAIAGEDSDRVGSLDDEEDAGEEESFDRQGVVEFLRRGQSADRVVLDSVSGLRAMTGSTEQYRRAVLDVIRLFNDEFDATALMTAEHFGTSPGGDAVETIDAQDAVQYNLHGVLRLWRQQVNGEFRRFIDVMKMRGVDHDSRAYEATIGEGGITVVSRQRPVTGRSIERKTLPTGIDGLDEVLGGGFERGGSVLLEYDEQSVIDPLLMAMGTEAVDEMLSLAFVVGVETGPRRLGALLEEMGAEMDSMLQNDQLFIIDTYGSWQGNEETKNVFDLSDETTDIRDALREIQDRARGRGTMYISDTPALVHNFGPQEARRIRNWMQTRVLEPQDLLVDVSNPDLVSEDMAAFFSNTAQQDLRTWVSKRGLQYLKVRKGAQTQVGTVNLVEFIEEKPYVQLR